MACECENGNYCCPSQDSSASWVLEDEWGSTNNWTANRKGYWIGYYSSDEPDVNYFEDEECEDGGAGIDAYNDPRLAEDEWNDICSCYVSKELKVFFEGNVNGENHTIIFVVGYHKNGDVVYNAAQRKYGSISSISGEFTTDPFRCHLCIPEPARGCNQHCEGAYDLGCDDCFTQHFLA